MLALLLRTCCMVHATAPMWALMRVWLHAAMPTSLLQAHGSKR